MTEVMKPVTYEVVVYDDGTAAISIFDRDGETGRLTYRGRLWRDQDETLRLLVALHRITKASR